MYKKVEKYIWSCVLLILACLFSTGSGFAGEYKALAGLNEVKAVFDVRGRNVKSLALQLDLIHKTYHDESVRKVTEQPVIAVVFGGGAVKLISRDREEYDDEEKMLLGLIEGKLAEMAKDGIRLEVCLFAVDVHDVDPVTIPEHIHRVDNGWISIIGYQAHGYSIVAVF